MRGWGLFFFLLFLLLIFAAIGWIVWTRLRASRQGLAPPPWKSYIPFYGRNAASTSNYPTPRASGPIEWLKDQLEKLRNKRTARGAYEETGNAADGQYLNTNTGTRGRGLEDDAWDARVGGGRDEEEVYAQGPGGYYEEQELGLAPTPGLVNEPYGGGGDYLRGGAAGTAAAAAGAERGRSHQRDGRAGLSSDPFGDQNEAASLRSVSPRPEADGKGHAKGPGSLEVKGDSPTSRRSMFREGL